MIRAVKDYPLVFEFSELDDETTDALLAWFSDRKPKHFMHRIHNRPITDGFILELIFDSKTDAMEFKLKFL